MNEIKMTADLDVIHTWLSSMYAGMPGWLSICSDKDGWRGRRFPTTDTGIAAATTYAGQKDAEGAKGVYHQVTTLAEQPTTGRGGEDLAHGLRGLWADLDYGTIGHAPSADGLPLPPDETAVLKVVSDSGLPAPTGIIWSGHGAYAWWWLADPHTITDPDRIKRLSTDWQSILAATALRHGWSHDIGVGNLDRLLRIPGTINRKAGREVLSHIGTEGSGSVYDLTELHAATDQLAPSARAALEEARAARAPQHAVPAPRPVSDRSGDGPFDVLQEKAQWADVLEGTGWVYVGKHGDGREKWKRSPDAESEYSALCSYDPPVMVVFSSAAGLEPGALPPGRKHTMGRVFAHFHYGDDVVEAGKDLMRAASGRPARRAAAGLPPTVLTSIRQRCQETPFRPPLQLAPTRTAPAPAASSWTAPTEEPVALPSPMPAREWDDLGNAERVIDRHGSEIRWLADIERWAYYDKGRWNLKAANTGVWTRVINTINQLEDEAPNYSDEPVTDANGKEGASQKEQFLAWARKQRMRPKLAAAREVLQAYPAVHTTMDAFDQPETLLNVANGIVDLTTGQLRAHDRGLYLMQQSPICYDPTAACPMWDKFLAGVMPDPERRAYLARVVGYSLTAATGEQVMFIHHGEGQNGKGVFMRVVMALLGDYAQAVPASTLMAKHGDGGIPNDIARMVGKRLLSTSETGRNAEGRGKPLDEELVKRLTGEDPVSARFLNAEFFEFKPVGKIHLATNHLPDVSGSHSMARRLQSIGWDVIVPPAKRIQGLAEKILAREAAGVLNWAIRGCLDWQKQGLAVPESVTAKTREHIAQSNPLATWLEEETDEVPDAVTENGQLYGSYKTWAERVGVRRPLSMKAFTIRLQEQGFTQDKDSRTRRSVTRGLALAILGGAR